MDFSALPIDCIIIALVLLSGIFQKKYLSNVNINSAWKTLIVSALFTTVYGLLVRYSGTYSKDLLVQWFFSYVTATSFYELLFKRFVKKYFPDDTLLLLLVMLLPLSSCNTVKKNKSSKAFSRAHHSKATKDSLRATSTVKDYLTLIDSISKEVNKTGQKNEMLIDFTYDSAKQYSPIIIEHEKGRVQINPGGRKIASLKLQSDSSASYTDSVHYSSHHAGSLSTRDTAAVHSDITIDSTAASTEHQFIKNSFRFAGVSLGLLLTLIGLLIYAIIRVKSSNDQLKKTV